MEMTQPNTPIPLSDPQRRTMDGLIGAGQPRPTFPSDLPQRLRDRIEEAVRGVELAEQLWLGKDKLTALSTCEGSFAAKIMGEAEPFEHSVKTAAGVLQHKAIEVEVGARGPVGPVEAVMISHAHNDHYTGIFALPDRASYQVWTLNRVAQVVDAPHKYLAPYVDARVPKVDRALQDREVIRWHELELKFHHLPGQTTFAMGVEVQVDGKRCLFTGDNFFHHEQYSGSGGWSGRNRGLPAGYVQSVEKIQAMRPDWILAEHGGAFEYHAEDFRRRRDFAIRAGELADRISPHGDHRIDWDPQRVRVVPLICPAHAGARVALRIVVDNPTNKLTMYSIQSTRPEIASPQRWKLTAGGDSTTVLDIELDVPSTAPAGRMVVPFIVKGDGGIDPSDAFVVLDVERSR